MTPKANMSADVPATFDLFSFLCVLCGSVFYINQEINYYSNVEKLTEFQLLKLQIKIFRKKTLLIEYYDLFWYQNIILIFIKNHETHLIFLLKNIQIII